MYTHKKIFDFGFAIDNPNYDTERNVKIMNILLFSALFVFSVINYFIKDKSTLALSEFSIAMLLVISTYLYNKFKNLKAYVLITTLILFIAMLFVHFFIELTHFSSLFLLFFPLVAFMINGLRIGLFVTLLYDIIILVDVYLKGTDGFSHLLVAFIAVSILSYYLELSRRNVFAKLQNIAKQLEGKSYIDELTSLFNRHYLNENILENTKLYGRAVMFFITDIDNFKSYNDFYGHPMGDMVIKEIADIKNKTVGSSKDNFVVRLGGEEFGGYIFDVEYAKDYIESFIKSINEAMMPHEKNQPYNICTVSIGAVYCEHFSKENYSKMYSVADEALYEAKYSGKNRVVYKEIV